MDLLKGDTAVEGVLILKLGTVGGRIVAEVFH
jgi:hypothetical protein